PVDARAFRVVDAQGAVAKHAGIRHPIVDAQDPAICRKQVPRDPAPHIETADIRPKGQLLAWRQLVANPETDEGIDPVHSACPSDGTVTGDDETRRVEGARQSQIDGHVLTPVASPG